MEKILDLIGKPFSKDGYGPDSFSCYGLAVEVFSRYGINIPITNIAVCACKQNSEEEIERHTELYWKKVEGGIINYPIPSAILIKAHPGYAQHIGIYIGDNKMIHVSASCNTCIDKIYEWKDRINGVYEYTGE